jgi:hypothetical protein
MILICRFKRHSPARQPIQCPLWFARSNAYLAGIIARARVDAQLDFGRTTPCPTVP